MYPKILITISTDKSALLLCYVTYSVTKQFAKSENIVYSNKSCHIHFSGDKNAIAVLSLALIQWVPWNPSILRGGFSNPSIFEKESIEIQYFEKLSNYIVFAGSSFALLHT